MDLNNYNVTITQRSKDPSPIIEKSLNLHKKNV